MPFNPQPTEAWAREDYVTISNWLRAQYFMGLLALEKAETIRLKGREAWAVEMIRSHAVGNLVNALSGRAYDSVAMAAESLLYALRNDPSVRDAFPLPLSLIDDRVRGFGPISSQDPGAIPPEYRYDFKARKQAIVAALSVAPQTTSSSARKPAVDTISSQQREKAAEVFQKGYYIYMRDKDAKGSLPFLREAVQLQPSSARYQALLGDALVKSGDATGGLTHLQKAADIDSSNAYIHMMLARGLAAAGQKKAAVTSADKAVAIWPNNTDIRSQYNEFLASIQAAPK